jgi:hypothetical protein
VTLRAGDVGIEVLVVGAEPEPVIDELGVLRCDILLQLELLLREGHRLEGGVGSVEDHRSRRLVDLPALDADEPVFDVVDAPDAVQAAEVVQPLDELDRAKLLPIEPNGNA